MIKKLTVFLFIVFMCTSAYCADFFTSRYNLCVPENGSRNWASKVSNDIISIDNVMYMMSQDITAITDDKTTTVGGVVGRMKVVSDDGSASYMLLYAPN